MVHKYYSANLTRIMEGHEIWLGDAHQDGDQAEVALFYGDRMRPDGSLDPKSISYIVYKPGGSTIKPSISSEKDRHLLRFSCIRDGCYTIFVELIPVVFTQTKDGWHRGPKSRFNDVIHSHAIDQMAKRILPVGESRLEKKEPLHGILEIVPGDVKVLKGGVADLRVFYEGTALAGAELRAVSEKMGKEMVRTKTDDQGWARVPLTIDGDWMFMAIHKDNNKSVKDEFDQTTFITTLVMEAQ